MIATLPNGGDCRNRQKREEDVPDTHDATSLGGNRAVRNADEKQAPSGLVSKVGSIRVIRRAEAGYAKSLRMRPEL